MIYLKYLAIVFLRFFLRGLYVFPVKPNRILLEASEGEIYGCNPKYIFLYLYEKYGNNLEYVWCLNDKMNMPLAYDVKRVKYLSFMHVFYLMTSKVIITNVGIEPFFPKRKCQLIINTWHGGGAYKDSGAGAAFLSKARVRLMQYMLNRRAEMTNYLVSSCRVWNPIYSRKFFIPENRILNIGLPRNDLFFRKEGQDSLRDHICRQYGIEKRKMMLLYAPTFRGYWRHSKKTELDFDVDKIKKTVEKRFGRECVILFRHHRFDRNQHLDHVVDVSDYQDMQELLVAVDILITDYSSSIWDFSLAYKPGFLYTPDLDSYEDETKFLTPIKEWQYPYAKSMEELCDLIMDYEEDSAVERIKDHHNNLGSFEDGHATEKVCEVIEKWLYKL